MWESWKPGETRPPAASISTAPGAVRACAPIAVMMPSSTRSGSSTIPAGVKTWPPVINSRWGLVMVSFLNVVNGRRFERVGVDRRGEVRRDPHGLGRCGADVRDSVRNRREVLDAVTRAEDDRLEPDRDLHVSGQHVEELLRIVVGVRFRAGRPAYLEGAFIDLQLTDGRPRQEELLQAAVAGEDRPFVRP